jgi:formate hydrogenlyase subunit 3/multisubunit Na+/H+ antiporter MnhD subunit
VYAYARLFVATVAIAPEWHTWVPMIAAASALVSAGAALVETDLKRIIAYSTVSQIAFIFLGLSVGNAIGVAGGLLYVLMHGIAKGGLFLCAGIVEQNTKQRDITRLGGLFATMPVTAIAFLLCAFSVMGVPPLGGFFSKYMVIWGAFRGGEGWVAAAFLVGAVLTIVYLFRVFTMVFLGQPAAGLAGANIREGSPPMVWSVAALAVLAVLSGVAIQLPAEFVQSTVQQLGVAP